MTVQPPPIYPLPPRRDRYVIATGVLIIIVIVLAAFLGLSLSTNGFASFRNFGTPRIVPPSPSSLTTPTNPNVSPQYKLWNSCGGTGSYCPMNSTGWREGGVPDTFDYFVSFTSNVPVKVYFLTLPQYMQFAYCSGKTSCVSGVYDNITAAISVQNYIFKLAEGCADYVAIYQSTGNGGMNPNISIAYNPYSAPTGICLTNG